MHWNFAGALVPAWELASVLWHWALVTEHGDHVNALAARALVDGYRSAGASFPSLDLSTFTVGISGWLNYVHSQICGAIDDLGADREAVAFSTRETLGMLARPMSVAILRTLMRTLE